jgi:hypothetical protein
MREKKNLLNYCGILGSTVVSDEIWQSRIAQYLAK